MEKTRREATGKGYNGKIKLYRIFTHEERIKWATETRLGAIWICCVQAQTANSNSAAETFLMCLRQNKGPAWVGAHDWKEE